MKKAYVVTYYYNNGEQFEEEYSYEMPKEVYFDLEDALKKDEFIKVDDVFERYLYRGVRHYFQKEFKEFKEDFREYGDFDEEYKEEYDDFDGDNLNEYYEHRIYECEVQEK